MSDEGRRGGIARRRRAVTALAVGAFALSGAGLWGATFVQSPAQAAAEAAPPEPDVLTASVERRILSDTVVTRGTVSASQTVDIAPAASAAEGGKPVVTKVLVQAGGTFRAGRVLMEISGRPVFVLPGTLPVYRDLKPGAHGEDVRQLQKALTGLGHGTGGDRKGEFGPGTKAAVTAFYASIGYDPVLVGGEGGEGGDPVEAARGQVKAAERALAGLTSGAAEKEASGDQLTYAREDLADARQKLADAEAVSGPMVPASEVAYLSAFPARVDVVSARVGGDVGEKPMTVSAGRLVVKGSLAAHEKGLVRAGQKVRILSEATGVEATGVVASVSEAPVAAGGGTDGETPQGQGYALEVSPDKALPATLAGQDVRLTVEAATSDGKVLVVPVSAVSAGADSRTTVTVLGKDGTRRRVEVRPGTSGDGYVEVSPVAGTLAEKELVIVGAGAVTGGGAGDGSLGTGAVPEAPGTQR
ncbi:peptidoglycan-binding protein [Streptomyces sp. Je 1-79]|uniref:peptidoglycan-binding protein n=1 Tax=Streptomyces sp. Je 1-79 TaxID=2943847 RepID=UPI0021A60A34|nr:peptidoglycan-binding protein [Streptomyces sp. Je 1-79]MCT4356588.1 peptidoglycan-binding protein [Streptomyces sp. Je 1-79]